MKKAIELELPVTATKPKSKGGARPGAGRKKGGTNQVSVSSLLEALEVKTNGKKYEEVLMEDFLKARVANDTQLIVKYHNLILNKLMTHVTKIEVTDSQETIDAKQTAFADALAKLTGLKKD
jgi:hypothetical protein